MLCSHKAEYTKADPPSLHVCLLGKSCSLASADMFSEEKKNQRLLLRKPSALFFFTLSVLALCLPLVLIWTFAYELLRIQTVTCFHAFVQFSAEQCHLNAFFLKDLLILMNKISLFFIFWERRKDLGVQLESYQMIAKLWKDCNPQSALLRILSEVSLLCHTAFLKLPFLLWGQTQYNKSNILC